MKRFIFIFFMFVVTCPGGAAMAQTTAPAAAPVAPMMSADEFAAKVDLSSLRTISVQHQQTLKTLDSFSRQVLETIYGQSSYNGQDPVFTVLDIAYLPENYQTVNLIKIGNVPLRTEFRRLTSISSDEQERIVKTGLVSLALLQQKDVQDLLLSIQASDTRKAEALGKLVGAEQMLAELESGSDLFLPAAVVPPAVGAGDTLWHPVRQVVGDNPDWVKVFNRLNMKVPPPIPGYAPETVEPVLMASVELNQAWQRRDAAAVKTAGAALASALVAVNPQVYPSPLLRNVEVVYNKLAKMTLPGAAFYFFALVLFLMSTQTGLTSLRLWGLRLLVLGFAIHSAGIAIRWWLTDTWLPPIKNEFESVMFSAWFGVLIGLSLELGVVHTIKGVAASIYRLMSGGRASEPVSASPRGGAWGRGILGAAASFVGFLSLIALFTVPYVLHVSIGENIGQVQGVLMTYWLYIHVMMVTASYSMIGMSFLLSSWWLTQYYLNRRTVSRVPSRQLEGGGHGFEPSFPAGSGAATLTMGATLARMIFFPVAKTESTHRARSAEKELGAGSINFLATLDACNLVVLQLAFWMLGTGIVLGAVWADQSWGRFWGWDPKETFALVTWIAYLVIVHIRVATADKAWWTSVLSICGFFLMLFNWIGVNYFLPGLHSYAG